jgi:hypothetical protein
VENFPAELPYRKYADQPRSMGFEVGDHGRQRPSDVAAVGGRADLLA